MKKLDNTVAICMATYNGEKYICEQIESILNQSYKEWVLFIRDDGSTDKTIKIIKKYIDDNPEKIFLIEDKRLCGGNSKKNFAAILNWINSKYEFNYFMFSDQDDVWLEDKIKVCIERMKIEEVQKSEPILIHTDLKVVDENLNVLGESFFAYRALNPEKKKLNELLVQNNITGCTMFWNKKLNDLINIENDDVAMHDWWFSLTAAALGRIICIGKPTILYRQHGNNVVGATRVNTISFIIKRLLGKSHVKETLNLSIIQAREFLKYYKEKLSDEQVNIIEEFGNIMKFNKIKRIHIVLKRKYLKQGFVQIIGELIFI